MRVHVVSHTIGLHELCSHACAPRCTAPLTTGASVGSPAQGDERVRYNFTFSERPDLHLPSAPTPCDCPRPENGSPPLRLSLPAPAPRQTTPCAYEALCEPPWVIRARASTRNLRAGRAPGTSPPSGLGRSSLHYSHLHLQRQGDPASSLIYILSRPHLFHFAHLSKFGVYAWGSSEPQCDYLPGVSRHWVSGGRTSQTSTVPRCWMLSYPQREPPHCQPTSAQSMDLVYAASTQPSESSVYFRVSCSCFFKPVNSGIEGGLVVCLYNFGVTAEMRDIYIFYCSGLYYLS